LHFLIVPIIKVGENKNIGVHSFSSSSIIGMQSPIPEEEKNTKGILSFF
jgi:hypothetical protein